MFKTQSLLNISATYALRLDLNIFVFRILFISIHKSV